MPSWSLATGLRYTHEMKDYYRTTSTFFGDPLSAADGTFAFNDSHSWSAMTPSISLQKQFDSQVMGYVSANRGFKSGGFNGRANSAAEVSTFDPEYVWTYEAGLKMRSASGRAQANFDVFHSDYKDFQARVSEITNPDDPIPSFSFPVLNAAKLSINGVEFEGGLLVGEGTRLSAQIGYMDAKYDEFNDPRTAVDPTLADLHDHVPFSPKWTARVAATQTFNLSGGSAITVGGDVSYRDDTWLSVDNRDGLMQPAYTLSGRVRRLRFGRRPLAVSRRCTQPDRQDLQDRRPGVFQRGQHPDCVFRLAAQLLHQRAIQFLRPGPICPVRSFTRTRKPCACPRSVPPLV